jgi:hypothetical protein
VVLWVRQRRWPAAVLVLTVVLALVGVSDPAAAQPADGSRAVPVRAVLGSRTFDMAKGWGSAQACVVLSRARVQCYSSRAEADAASGYAVAVDPAVVKAAEAGLAAVPSCPSGWLCLYQDVNGGGRRLQFRDEYWNYLSDYGFARQTSSWRNNQGSSDTGYLSLYNYGSTYLLRANSYASSMGVYNDQAYAAWG